MNVENKVAIVTGSTSGIGQSIAETLANAGCKVMFNSATSVEKGEMLAHEFSNAAYCQADIADEKQCEKLVQQTLKTFGQIDILINNAGYSERVPHDDLYGATDELFQKMWNVNLMGTWHLSRAAMEHLKKSECGNIVNISSIAGTRACGSSIPYAVSKAAVNHLTLMLAKSCGPEVKVNAIAPGFISTPRTENWPDAHEYFESNTTLQKAGKPEDIANLLMGMLASDFMTGQIVTCDGGFMLG